MFFSHQFTEGPYGPWKLPKRKTESLYHERSPGCGHPPSSSSSLPSSRISSPEGEGNEPFLLSPSRGYFSTTFPPAVATLQDLFWNILGKSLRCGSLVQYYSQCGGYYQLSNIFGREPELPGDMCAHLLWTGDRGPAFLPMLLLLEPPFKWQIQNLPN